MQVWQNLKVINHVTYNVRAELCECQILTEDVFGEIGKLSVKSVSIHGDTMNMHSKDNIGHE